MRRIRGAQSRMLRRMLRIKRWDGEELDELIIRSNSLLKHRLRDTNIKHSWWGRKYVQLRLDWVGHVARLRKHDPPRRTYRVFNHWNYNAIRHVSGQHEGKQHHGRYIQVWRWECYLYTHIGRAWYDDAQNRDAWKACASKAIEPIICKFGPR